MKNTYTNEPPRFAALARALNRPGSFAQFDPWTKRRSWIPSRKRIELAGYAFRGALRRRPHRLSISFRRSRAIRSRDHNTGTLEDAIREAKQLAYSANALLSLLADLTDGVAEESK